MNANWRQVASSVLLCIGLAAPTLGQQEEANKNAKAQDHAGVVQELRVNQNVVRDEQLLTFELANVLFSSNDLGVDLAEIQPALRAQLNVAEGIGLVVTGVPADSPGAKAGLQPHDVLVQIGTTSVGKLEQLAEALRKAQGESADKTAMLGVIRQGKPLTLHATPKSPWVAELALSDAPVRVWTQLAYEQVDRYRIGVVLSEADDTLRAQVGLAAGEGLIVTEVYPDTPAAKAGIQVHDILVILDGKRLITVDAINEQIQEIKDRDVELKLLRSGKEVTLKVAPVKEAAAALADLNRQGLTIWNAGGCPAQVQKFNCRSCHSDPHASGWVTKLHGYHYYGGLPPKTSAAAGSPQEQVNQLKAQLAKMQQTIVELEAAIQASDAEQTEGNKGNEKP